MNLRGGFYWSCSPRNYRLHAEYLMLCPTVVLRVVSTGGKVTTVRSGSSRVITDPSSGHAALLLSPAKHNCISIGKRLVRNMLLTKTNFQIFLFLVLENFRMDLCFFWFLIICSMIDQSFVESGWRFGWLAGGELLRSSHPSHERMRCDWLVCSLDLTRLQHKCLDNNPSDITEWWSGVTLKPRYQSWRR